MGTKTQHTKLKQFLRSTTAVSAAAVFTLMQTQATIALPQGAQVQSGQVAFDQQGNSLTVNQGSNKAIINWQSFDIGANESTHFNQPSANAVALNRITGSQHPSQIFGSLTATGKLILINPNGMVFGPNSQVDVGGIIASTADIANQDFLNGKYDFSILGAQNAKIINFGNINAADSGLAALIAPGVENHGVIAAREGTVVLAGAETATLDMFGDGLINFAIDGKSTGIHNQGILKAEAGQVVMTAQAARGVVDNLVNVEGVVEASSAHADGGAIILGAGSGKMRVAGQVSAKGDVGGTIEVTGDTVALEAADIDASGLSAGGKIRIGGDKRGEDKLQMASLTTVDRDSAIRANATQSGEGGDIAIWSEGATDFEGHVEAKGVSKGGFAEVSSTGQLGFDGTADLSATSGENGTLLLDPDHVVIGANNANDAEIADQDVQSGDGTGTFYISALAVVNALDVSNVVIEAIRTLTVNDAIDASSKRNGSSLTLDAQTITLNNIIKLNDGNLNLYGSTIAINNTVNLKNGGRLILGTQNNAGGAVDNFTLNTGAEVIANSFQGEVNRLTQRGNFTLSNDFNATVNTLYNATGNVTAADAYNVLGNADVRLADVTAKTISVDSKRLTVNGDVRADRGALALDGNDFITVNDGGSVESTRGGATFNSDAGSITFKGTFDVRDNASVTANRDVTFEDTLHSNSDVTVTAGRHFTARDSIDVNDLSVTANNRITISGTVTASDDVRLDAQGDRISVTQNITAADEIDIDAQSSVTLAGVEGKTVNVKSANSTIRTNGDVIADRGALVLDSERGVDARGQVISRRGGATLSANNGSVTMRADVDVRDNMNVAASSNIAAQGNIHSNGDVTFTAGRDVTIGGDTDVNDLNINATRNATINGTVTASDDVNLNANGTLNAKGDITASDEVNVTGNRAITEAVTGKTVDVDVTNSYTANGDITATRGTVNVDADRGVNLKGDVNSDRGGATINSDNGGVTVSGDIDVRDAVDVDAKNRVTLAGVDSSNGDVNIDSNDRVTVTGPVASGDDVTITGNKGIFGGADLNANDEITLNANGDVRIGGIDANGDVDVNSTRTVVIDGDTNARNLDISDNTRSVSLLGDTTVDNTLSIDPSTAVTLGGQLNAGTLDIDLDRVNVTESIGDIQYAIDIVNDGGLVYVNAGNYNQHSLNLNRGIRVQGAGKTRTFINATGGDHAFIVGGNADNGRIQNLAISGAAKAAIHIDTGGVNLSRFTLSGLDLSNNGAGVTVADGSDVSRIDIGGSIFSNNTFDGFNVEQNAVLGRLQVRTSEFNNNGANGLDIEAGARVNNLDVATSKFNNNADTGLLQTKGNNNTIRTSEFKGNSKRGMAIDAASAGDVNWVRIYDNDFGGAQAEHIAFDGDFDVRNKANRTTDLATDREAGLDQLKGENGFENLVVLENLGNRWVANGDGSYSLFGQINGAIDKASSGDTLAIAAGTYNENIVLDKAVNLVGAGADDTIINAQGAVAVTETMGAGEDTEIAGLNFTNGTTGFLSEDGTGNEVRITDSLFDNFSDAAIDISDAQGARAFDRLALENVTFEDNDTALRVSAIDDSIRLRDIQVNGGDIGIELLQAQNGFNFDNRGAGTNFDGQDISAIFFRNARRAFDEGDVSGAQALRTALVRSDFVARPVAPAGGTTPPAFAGILPLQNRIFSEIENRSSEYNRRGPVENDDVRILNVDTTRENQNSTVVKDLESFANGGNGAGDTDE